MKNFLIILLLLPLGKIVGQQINMSNDLKHAFSKVMELKLDEAERLIQRETSSNAKNLASTYLKGVVVSVKMFVEDDKVWFEKNVETLEDCIASLEKASDNDPQKRMMISELRLSLAIQHAKYQNNIRAGVQFYKAYHLLQDNFEKFPDYYPTYVPLGVLNAAVGSLPDGYQSIASVIGITGSVEKGMKLIKKGYWNCISDKKWRHYRDYFGFTYAYASLKLVGSDKVSPESLSLNYSKSSYLTYMQSMIEVKKGNARKAVNILLQRPKGEVYYNYHYLDYYTGKLALSFSPDTAEVFLKRFLQQNNSDNYKKSTYRYLSWSAMLKGDSENVKAYRNRVKKEGSLNTGADKQAQREVEVPLNEALIKGRIWFDGGLYEKAAQFLESNASRLNGFSQSEKVEYHYRLGRIYQEMDRMDDAIASFKRALQIELDRSTFPLGNSALQTAQILEENGNDNLAKVYYKKTLTYKGYPFYEGIHQQAKSGLDRLER
jgi:tetratricopeptide (TPR) repeat protein